MKKYNLCVFIGRMEPPTIAHINNIKKAAEVADRVLVLFGSAEQPRTMKNPFLVDERAEMVSAALGPEYADRVQMKGIRDHMYNNTKWAEEVQIAVDSGLSFNDKVAIIGHRKDSSSFYLDMFPQWDYVEADFIENVSATDIRDEYFGMGVTNNPTIPVEVQQYLTNFMQTKANEYYRLVREWKYIKKYKLSWESAPYPVNLVCVDACVIKSGHILMVRRKSEPGEGLIALPGGYLNVDETLQEAVIRELREETKLKVPSPVLIGSIKAKEMFDHPNRSLRGRVLTMTYLFDLGVGALDKVKGGDDASHAFWVALNDLDSKTIFEDHHDIIGSMVGRL